MRIFLGGLLLSVILLVVVGHFLAPVIQPSTPKLPVHRMLELERSVDDNTMFHVLEAAIEWNEATDGQVIFDIERLPHKNISRNAIIILNVSPDFPDIIWCDFINGSKTLGYFNASPGLDSIELVKDRLTEKYFRSVITHELGHALGLEHTDVHGTLMYPLVNNGSIHITNSDLKQFCKLYHCDPSKLHGYPEIQQNIPLPVQSGSP